MPDPKLTENKNAAAPDGAGSDAAGRPLLARPRRRPGAVLVASVLGVALVAALAAALYSRAHSAPPGVIAVSGAADISAYRGLASWIDLYDSAAWSDPAGAVQDMASHGVRTIFVETANSSSSSGLVHPDALATIVAQAHGHHMRVVAWYLPNLRQEETDFERVGQAIAFTTADGQRFDSFALDIESTVVKSEPTRNSRLTTLSHRIRSLVGTGYPLGAIIPPPVALQSKKGYWQAFPYTALAQTYDVFLPMHYYTFSKRTPAQTYATTLANVRILREQPGCAATPVHMIGGLTADSSAAQVDSLMRGVQESGCIGASLYGWAGTTEAQWRELARANALAFAAGP